MAEAAVQPAHPENGIFYKAPPTVARFMSEVPEGFSFRIIMGPFGSGKTSGCVCHIPQLAMMQPPDADGVRRTRFAIVRSTFVELEKTTIRTFMDWLRPEELGLGIYLRSKKEITLTLGRGWGRAEANIHFFALDEMKDEAKLKSFETTWFFPNETVEINPDLFPTMRKRVGRYPSKKNGPGAKYYGIFGDTNPPDEGDLWWSLMENYDPERFGVPLPESERSIIVYKQPSGQSPEAENLENLPDGYYTDTRGMSPDDIRTKIHGMYGRGKFGRPVIGGFNPEVHIAKRTIRPVPGLPMVVGMDCALTPAMVFLQVVAFGRVVVLGECIGMNMGADRFCKYVLRPFIASRGWEHFDLSIFMDPTGGTRSQADERTVPDIMRKNGFRSKLARTNSQQIRIAAAEELLGKMVDGEPAFVIDPRCEYLIAALRGGYRYHQERIGEIVKAKNETHSHIADAFQYAALHAGTSYGGARRRKPRVIRADLTPWTG